MSTSKHHTPNGNRLSRVILIGVLALLVGCQRAVPPSGEGAIFEAVEAGDVNRVRQLLKTSPSVLNELDDFGFTPLMRAVASMERTTAMIQAFIDAGADVNAKTVEDYTALHMLAGSMASPDSTATPEQIVKLLKDVGADLEVRQHWGWTPLMGAAVEGTIDELKAFVDAGADVNKKFPLDTLPEFLGGRTTLMAVIAEPEKTKMLIDAGVDLRAVDDHGQNVLEYAEAALAEAAANPVDLKELGIDEPVEDDYGSRVKESMQRIKKAW
jgi:ankyrin repeat protein